VQDLTIVAKHTIYSAVVGSRAYGLSGPASDTDRRGVFQAPTSDFWRLDKPPTHVEGPLPEQFSWEVERACTLALAANPTVWECLYSPLVEHVTDAGRALLELRPAFLSRRAARTYGDYARDQLAKLTSTRARTGEVRWKQAMHMARLLRAGAHVLRTGEVLVDVTAHRDELLAIRAGDLTWEQFTALAADLEADLSAAESQTALPESPDRAAVERFLVSLRSGAALGVAPAFVPRPLPVLDEIPSWAGEVADEHPYPLVFATVSGAHLYGFASVDSDLDLRACHVLPLHEVVGLRTGPETVQSGGVREDMELDVVSQELAKFVRLLLRPNGYVLEQLLSPLVVRTSALHEELKSLAPGCLTPEHARHYLGFAAGQWQLYQRTGELKPALYTLRVLHTGIHLMRTGEVQADLRVLNTLPYVTDLIEAKKSGEHDLLTPSLVSPARLSADVERLTAELESARDASSLPVTPSATDALNALLIRTRLAR
jgi:predicted nucleotidyltransferase